MTSAALDFARLGWMHWSSNDAARLGHRTARPHARPAASSVPHEDSRHEVAMSEQKKATVCANGEEDARFTGVLPNDTKLDACGVPWTWAGVCLAPPELRERRIQFDRMTRRRAGERERMSQLPRYAEDRSPDTYPWEGHAAAGAQDSQKHQDRKAAEMSSQRNDISNAEAKALKDRLARGAYRGVGRRGGRNAPLEWMARDLWNGDFLFRDADPRKPACLNFAANNEVWWDPHVFAGDFGIPPYLAMIGYGDAEQALTMVDLFWPDNIRGHLQRGFLTDAGDGRFRIAGHGGHKGEKLSANPIPADDLDTGEQSPVRVGLPIPGAPPAPDAPWTGRREREVADWLIAAISNCPNRSKTAWQQEAAAQFPPFNGSGFNRAWEVAARTHPHIKGAGRKRTKIE